MLNASGDAAVIPPTRYVFGAFGGTQRTVGATLAEFAVQELKGKRLALVAHDDDYGKANVATIRAVAARLGVQLVAAESISPRVTDVTAPMLKSEFARTPEAKRGYAERLEEIRSRGLSRVQGDLLAGIASIAAPVFRHDGTIVAVIAALGPQGAFDVSWDGAIGKAVKRAAQTLSRRLGSAARGR